LRMNHALARGSHFVRISSYGVLVGGASIGLLVFGLANRDGMLAAIGIAGVLLLGSAFWLGKWNLSGCELRVESARSVHARQRLAVRWIAQQQKRFFGVCALQWQMSLCGGINDKWEIPYISASGSAQRDALLIPTHRGSAREHLVSCHSSFPLGFWLRKFTTSVTHDLTVFPYAQRPKQLNFSGRARDAASPLSRLLGQGGGEWRGLRAWQAGDSPRRIHAAASSRSQARGLGLMVSECDPPGHLPRRVVVIFHSHGQDGALIRPEVFEQALSLLSGVLQFLVHQSIPALFLADFDHWLERCCENRVQLREIFHILAKARRLSTTEMHDLTRVKAQYDDDDSWIVVSDMAAESWRHAFASRDVSCDCLSPLSRWP
jgi:uncharacterized protein (DUF58 family)